MGKWAFFAAGYVLGTRAGRQRYHQLVSAARWLAAREATQTTLGLARAGVQVAWERGLEQLDKQSTGWGKAA
jgi:hypothetical protein